MHVRTCVRVYVGVLVRAHLYAILSVFLRVSVSVYVYMSISIHRQSILIVFFYKQDKFMSEFVLNIKNVLEAEAHVSM